MPGPVDLADLKVHLNLDGADTSQDGYLTALLATAYRACEQRIGRPVAGGDDTLSLDCFPGGAWWRHADPQRRDHTILLPGPVSAIVAVRYRAPAGQISLLDPATYVADITRDPARLAPIGAWPSTADAPGSVVVTFTRAPLIDGDVAMVNHAVRLLVGSWHANREAVATERFTPDELPLSVSWLLDPLRSIPVVQP